MRRELCWLAVMALAWPTAGAECRFDFSQMPVGQPPPGFRSTVSGQGNPGEWKIILDDVPAAPPNAPAASSRAVLAQLSQDPTDEHFPLLIFEEQSFGDFTLTTRFKTVSGTVEQMAGVAFRIQDEKNYYVVRASSLGNTFRFYKVVKGQRGPPIGPALPIPSGVWHELAVECKGNQIRCWLNGREPFPALHDSTFLKGKIGFWTKSDSVSYFADTKVVYTPREILAAVLVREALEKYPRLLGLDLFAYVGNPPQLQVVASKDPTTIGRAGQKVEQEVVTKGTVYYGREKDSCSVVLPLRDRNGDPVAAVRVVLKAYTGQTQQNAYIRALPVVRGMQARVRDAKDLTE